MIILSFDSLEALNQYAFHRLVENVDGSNSSIISFDMHAAYVVKNDLYQSLRNHIESGLSYSDFKDSISSDNIDPSTNLDVVSTFELYSPVGSSNVYLFPYSRKDFISTYFSDLIPTLANPLFDLMKSTGRITQIGGGSGKALVLRLSEMNQSHYESLPSSVDPEILLSNLESTISTLRNNLLDKDYYISEINKRDKIIQILNQEIESLNNRVLHAYQTTWR